MYEGVGRTPEACQEISRGLSERERAQPRLSETKESGALPGPQRGVEDSSHPCRGAHFVDPRHPGVRAQKTCAYSRLIYLHASGVRVGGKNINA